MFSLPVSTPKYSTIKADYRPEVNTEQHCSVYSVLVRRISYGEAPAAGREWDCWHDLVSKRRREAASGPLRISGAVRACSGALGLACLTHVDGPRVDMQLARFSRELPRLFLCGHSIFAAGDQAQPGSPIAWRAAQPDCSAAARALSSMPFSAAPLSSLGHPAQCPVALHTCPRISSQAGFH